MNGTIARLVAAKGFGFIKAGPNKEFFFHRSVVINNEFDQLHEGQAVVFDESQGPKGPRAENVRTES